MKHGLTPEEVHELPVVLDAVTAGRLLGIGRTSMYALLERGEFPAPALRVGKLWRIPTAGVCALLGITYPPAAPPATSNDFEGIDHENR